MKSLNEQSFHILMGVLLVGSCLLDSLLGDKLPSWDPPMPSLLTLVIGLVWIGRFSTWRLEIVEERNRVIEDRIERLERKNNALEDELRRLHS